MADGTAIEWTNAAWNPVTMLSFRVRGGDCDRLLADRQSPGTRRKPND
jgi:protein gp37